MNSLISIPLTVIAWIFTLIRLRAILRSNIRTTDTITFNIWGVVLFFSISFTFVIKEFITFFNAQTLPNFSLFITNTAFLVSQYFGMAGIFAGMNIPNRLKIIARVRLLLAVEIIVLFIFYIFFVSKSPETISFFMPQSNPEAIFIILLSSFQIFMSIIIVTTSLIYLPAKEFALLHLNTISMVLCVFLSALFFLTRIVTFGSYIWNFQYPPIIVPISYVSVITATSLFFFMLLSNRLHARFIILLGVIKNWATFQDLKYLTNRLKLLCPIIGLPLEDPTFWQFFSKPDYYLYRAIIIILDTKTILSDFLSDSMEPGTPEIAWEAALLPEVIRINDVLQRASPSDEFADIVETYRRVSHDLFTPQKESLTQTG